MIDLYIPEMHFISPLNPEIYTIFVNGIFNTKELAKTITDPHLGKLNSFSALLNPTHGNLPDLRRIQTLKRGNTTASAQLLFEHLKEVSPKVNRIVLIGHSEGGLIIQHALKKLEKEHEVALLKRITVYTLGSSAFIQENQTLAKTLAKVRNYMTINDTFCILQNPQYLFHFFKGALLLLKNRLLGKTTPVKMENKSLQFFWPTSFNPLTEHAIREANYQKIFCRKISGKVTG